MRRPSAPATAKTCRACELRVVSRTHRTTTAAGSNDLLIQATGYKIYTLEILYLFDTERSW